MLPAESMEREQTKLIPLNRLISIVAGWAEGEEEIARVHVFGSRVRGCTKDGGVLRPGFGPDSSDLDVAVELTGSARQALERRIDLAHRWRPELQKRLPVRLQLEVLDPNETPYVAGAVAGCSRLVYERNRRSTRAEHGQLRSLLPSSPIILITKKSAL